MNPLKIIGAVSAGASAVGQMQAGRAQARAYQAQAEQADLRAKQAALQYRQDGVNILRRVNQTTSTVTARAAAGGIDPFSGTPQSLRLYAQSTGAEEFYLSQENAQLSLITGQYNRSSLESAASQARRQGFMNAIGTAGQAAFTSSMIGGPPSDGGVAPISSQPTGQLSVYNMGYS